MATRIKMSELQAVGRKSRKRVSSTWSNSWYRHKRVSRLPSKLPTRVKASPSALASRSYDFTK
jgi:hypothetical protein